MGRKSARKSAQASRNYKDLNNGVEEEALSRDGETINEDAGQNKEFMYEGKNSRCDKRAPVNDELVQTKPNKDQTRSDQRIEGNAEKSETEDVERKLEELKREKKKITGKEET